VWWGSEWGKWARVAPKKSDLFFSLSIWVGALQHESEKIIVVNTNKEKQ